MLDELYENIGKKNQSLGEMDIHFGGYCSDYWRTIAYF